MNGLFVKMRTLISIDVTTYLSEKCCIFWLPQADMLTSIINKNSMKKERKKILIWSERNIGGKERKKKQMKKKERQMWKKDRQFGNRKKERKKMLIKYVESVLNIFGRRNGNFKILMYVYWFSSG